MRNAAFNAGFTHFSRWVNPPTPLRGAFSGQPPEIKTLLTQSSSPACSQAEIFTTSHQKVGSVVWPRSSKKPISANIQCTVHRCDATPIWVILHFDPFESCWHSEAPLCIIPHKLRRRREQRGGGWVGRRSRNLRRSEDGRNQNMGSSGYEWFF